MKERVDASFPSVVLCSQFLKLYSWSLMEPLGASYFQGSYIQGGRQVSGSLTDNSALRNACERIERIEQVIEGKHPLASADICQPCLYDVSRKVDRHVRDARLVMKAYDSVLQSSSTEASRRTSNSVPSSTSRAIDQYLQSVDLAHLLAASDDLARDIQQLEEDERRLTEQEAANCAERRCLLQQLSQQSLEEADLEYCLSRCEQTLPRLHTLLDASGHELNYLQRQNQPTGQRTLSINLSPLFDTPQVYQSQYGILNGRRLAYVEQPRCQLMWDEINASWSNLATMLLCIRNGADLPTGIHMQRAHNLLYQLLHTPNSNPTGTNNTAPTSVPSAFAYSHIVQLRPLKDHTLLQVHCTRTYSSLDTHNRATMHSTHRNNTGNNGTTATREFVLHLEGGVGSPVQATDSDRGKKHHQSTHGYDDTNHTNREYRTAVLTLACAMIGTILEVHYQKGTNGTTNPPPNNTENPVGTFAQVIVLETLFNGLMQDLACVLIITGDQLCFAVPQHSVHPRTLYTSTVGHTATICDSENNSVRNLTSNGFTINSIYPTSNTANSSPTNTNSNINNNTTVNVGIVNASTLANSVLANSTLLRTTLFDSVAYFGAYAGITGPSAAATTDNDTKSISNNNTGIVPSPGDFTPPRRVVSTENSPVKPSERVVYDTSPSNPDTPHSNDHSNNGHTNSYIEKSEDEESIVRQKFQRRFQLLEEYKLYCVHTNTPCDVYSALLVSSELELREEELMQTIVIDMMHMLNRNFRAPV